MGRPDEQMYVPIPVALLMENLREVDVPYRRLRAEGRSPKKALLRAIPEAIADPTEQETVVNFLKGGSDGQYGAGAGRNLSEQVIGFLEQSYQIPETLN